MIYKNPLFSFAFSKLISSLNCRHASVVSNSSSNFNSNSNSGGGGDGGGGDIVGLNQHLIKKYEPILKDFKQKLAIHLSTNVTNSDRKISVKINTTLSNGTAQFLYPLPSSGDLGPYIDLFFLSSVFQIVKDKEDGTKFTILTVEFGIF